MSADFGALIAFGALASLLLLLGWRRSFFTMPHAEWVVPIRFVHLIGAFAIYFIVNYLSTSLALSFLRQQIVSHYLAYASWLNFIVSGFIFVCLAIYLSCLPRAVRKGILHRDHEQKPWFDHLSAAAYAWILALPFVLFLSQLLEWILFQVFHITQLPDQIAVHFLKSTFDNPLYFFLAVLSIVVLAPLIEETLFRGFLQTYIRQHLGSKQAILITSVCFSLFHYAAGQGLANLSIIPSLFVLALFLGFLYEKQGSILASMVLHALFNAISVINLYLFGGFTTGL